MLMKEFLANQARDAKAAARILAGVSTEMKNSALLAMADAILARQDEIIAINAEDVKAALEKGTRKNMIDRLTLNPARIEAMAEGLRQTAALPDPIGQEDFHVTRPNGLKIRRVRVPFGVIGIIYEARPNVTVDAAALCLKSGNACILRGGSEAIRTNKKLTDILIEAATSKGLPEHSIEFVAITDRDAVVAMCRLRKLIDVIIPRGGAGLITRVVEHSTVPVIETGTGVCHIYVDKAANFEIALPVVLTAKISRPSVCNAMETLLVHKDIAEEFLPKISKLMTENNVELRGDELSRKICPDMKVATEEDWAAEYSDLILAVKVVNDIDEAIAHINKYNTEHSEAIITDDKDAAKKFQTLVDAAAVYVNTSTRFTDGFEFGFGAEIGISTQKLHARGPMGLEALTTMKYLIDGNGQTR
ncbi:MAG: glutamate-5-semialdehyde dehydrogenase [Selenomonadaceae bacterium]|nr:glutamate-5-semialdehyde dehydrogenase [Selenomonadaceae bacterium]